MSDNHNNAAAGSGTPTTAPTPPLSSLPLFHSTSSPAAALATPPTARTVPTQHTTTLYQPPPAVAPRSASSIDWTVVRLIREQAAAELANRLAAQGSIDDDARRELGRAIVTDLLNSYARDALTGGTGVVFNVGDQQALSKAVMDALFGLGRFQPLVEMEDVENIEVYGHDRVYLEFADGHVVMTGELIADSDEDLIDDIAFIAARSDGNERSFSPDTPTLHLRLNDGSRLAASAWITPFPHVVIRRHRLRRATIAQLAEGGLMSPSVASFLTAAVLARKAIVLVGAQGAGKTTLLRALAAVIPATEHIATVETEYELHLHELVDRHPRCTPWEARPGSGERRPDGSRAGEITLDDILYDSFRFNLKRLFVGEVRGKEILSMFKAMQGAAGSMSTTHGYSARAGIERLVTCAMEAGAHVTEQFAYRQVAEHVDLLVYIKLEDTPIGDNDVIRERYISEIIAIEQGERSGLSTTELYTPGPDGRAVPHAMNEEMKALASYGFNAGEHLHGRPAA